MALDAYLGLPDPTKRVSNPSADRARAVTRELFRRDPPGFHLDNPWEQAKSVIDYQYLALASIRDGLYAATFRVMQRRAKSKTVPVSRKALPTAHSRGDDYEYVPAEPDHPLCQLFNDDARGPNPVETVGDMFAQGVMHLEIYGESFLWITNEDGGIVDDWDEAELYYVPKPLLMNPLPMSNEYPKGGYRVTNFYPGVIGGMLAGGSVEIDRRDIIRHRYPHPLYRFSGYSPLAAGAKTIDVLRAINTAWKNHMDHGWSAEVVAAVDGITQEQADALAQRMENKFAGAEGRKIAVVDGERMDLKMLNVPAKDMEYQQGYDRATGFVSALYRTSPEMLGFKTPTSYAALYAQLKAQTLLCLKPRADKIAADYTKQLALKYWPDDNLRIEIDLPKIDDHEVMDAELNQDAQNGTITYNEYRALRNRSTVEGGDVPVPIYLQQLSAPQQGPEGGAPGDGPEGGGAHPLDSIGDAVMEALGIQGGDEPGMVQKAYDEAKHVRDHGKFSSKPGAGARPSTNGKPAGVTGVTPDKPKGQLPPEVQRHPKVLAAMGTLAKNATALAGKVGAALQAAGMTPADLHGTIDDWIRIYVTNNADVVSHTLGIDAMTAAHVLSHLVSHAVKLVAKHLRASGAGPAGEGRRTPLPAPSSNGNGKHHGPPPTANGPPRPENRAGKGSLPPKMGTKKSLRKLLKGLK